MKLTLIALLFVADGVSQKPPNLVAQIGRNACNAASGVYVGKIVDVIAFDASGQATSWVYVVERDGRRMNMPPDNTIVTTTCRDGLPKAAPAKAATTAPAAKAPPAAQSLSPLFAAVSAEFERRLVKYHGRVTFLQEGAQMIRVGWISGRCDMVEAEVIDFLISLNRGYPGRVTQNIEATRRCGNDMRQFRATAASFELFRTGKISDADILRGLQ
jgi:hypothetical protein